MDYIPLDSRISIAIAIVASISLLSPALTISPSIPPDSHPCLLYPQPYPSSHSRTEHRVARVFRSHVSHGIVLLCIPNQQINDTVSSSIDSNASSHSSITITTTPITNCIPFVFFGVHCICHLFAVFDCPQAFSLSQVAFCQDSWGILSCSFFSYLFFFLCFTCMDLGYSFFMVYRIRLRFTPST